MRSPRTGQWIALARIDVAHADVGTEVEVGQMVGNAWLWSACGVCEFCRQGWETLCESQQNTGYSVNGGFA